MDNKPKIKLSLINKKILHGEFFTERDHRIELHNAFFSECPTFTFNISIRIEDIVLFIEDKEDCYTNAEVGKFITDDKYAQSEGTKKEDAHYVPQRVERDGRIIVGDDDLGKIEDICVEQQVTQSVNGHVPLYDQIRENEKRFGTKIEFDESLYTSELDKESEYYKNNIERVKKIEQRILKDRKRGEVDDEENSLAKSKEGGWRRGSKNLKGFSKEEEVKGVVKQVRQMSDKLQNKEQTKTDDLNISKDSGEINKMLNNDNKNNKGTDRGWRRENGKRRPARKEGEEIVGALEKLHLRETTGAELMRQNEVRLFKEKVPTDGSIKVVPVSAKANNEVGQTQSVPQKRISYGKPNEGKYKTLADLYDGIVESFKGSKETKNWGHADDYKNYKSYHNDYYSYNKYSK